MGIGIPPYSDAIGVVVDHEEDGRPVMAMDFGTQVMGRPGYLHGGAISGLMEMAAVAALRTELERRGEAMRLKPVNIQVEFTRGGTEQRTFAMGQVTRAGRRVALVNAEAWQEDRTRPFALAQMKFLLNPAE